jgi:hypothetical protein
MTSIDHSNTRVLLIGTSKFPFDNSIHAIPNVESNINVLKGIFTNSDFIGIPEANITVSLNEDRKEIEKKLLDISDEACHKKDTLLVYYTGHGILSSKDYQLYLTTINTSTKYLEIEGINIDNFRKYIRQCYAGRKIVILDCCHSGYIISSMGDMTSKIQSELQGFEGTYVMTSAAQDEPSLFPENDPQKPTYFTGKLAQIIEEGLEESESEYCTLRDIYRKIELDFVKQKLPKPQQSNFNSADEIYFSKNKKFIERTVTDESAWQAACKKNTKWAFIDFKNQFPESKYANDAKKRVYEMEEEEYWHVAKSRDTLLAYDSYAEKYPEGKYVNQAKESIAKIRENEEKEQQLMQQRKEESLWVEAKMKNEMTAYIDFLKTYPKGKFAEEAELRIQALEEEEKIKKQKQQFLNDLEQRRKEEQKLQQEESIWLKACHANTMSSYSEYLDAYPNGTFYRQAKVRMHDLQQGRQSFNPPPPKTPPVNPQPRVEPKPNTSSSQKQAYQPIPNKKKRKGVLSLILIPVVILSAIIIYSNNKRSYRTSYYPSYSSSKNKITTPSSSPNTESTTPSSSSVTESTIPSSSNTKDDSKETETYTPSYTAPKSSTDDDYDNAITCSSIAANVEHNAFVNGFMGMKIYPVFTINNAKGAKCRVSAYFYYQNGNELKDRDQLYHTDDGNVSTGQDFTPCCEATSYNSNEDIFYLFLPYYELDLQVAGNYYLKFDMVVWHGTEQIIKSAYFNFSYQKY